MIAQANYKHSVCNIIRQQNILYCLICMFVSLILVDACLYKKTRYIVYIVLVVFD